MKLTKMQEARVNALAKDGRVTPAAVVADAKKPSSPLHKLFPWDVKKAAQERWLDIGREIIRSVRVVVTTSTTVIKAPHYVHDPTIPANKQGYVSVVALRQEPESARDALLEECRRAASYLERAREAAAALDLVSEVDRILEELTGLRRRLDEAA